MGTSLQKPALDQMPHEKPRKADAGDPGQQIERRIHPVNPK
jgi:hypothetical protein